jgi:hypothetical protein
VRVDEDNTVSDKKASYLTFLTKDGGKNWSIPETNPNIPTETVQDSATGFEGIMKIISNN